MESDHISNDKPLSENLQEHYKAIESEFTLNSDTTAAEQAREKLASLLPEATRALEQLLLMADSDAVRLSSIKLVFEHTLGKPGAGTAEDEITKLIQSLTAKKPAKESKTDKAK